MNQSDNWIDISLTIYSGMPYWPDNPSVNVEPSQCLAHGDVCNVSKMTIGTHTGTHVDGINHFIKGGMGIDQMPLDATIGKARVIEIKDSESIKVAEIEPHNIQTGERILFKTQNSDREAYPEREIGQSGTIFSIFRFGNTKSIGVGGKTSHLLIMNLVC